MIILGTTSALVKVTTGSALAMSVHCSYADFSVSGVTPGSQNTLIATATTTTVLGSPAASTQRNLKTMCIANTSASPNLVTLSHTDGTTQVVLMAITLQAGFSLLWTDQLGFELLDVS